MIGLDTKLSINGYTYYTPVQSISVFSHELLLFFNRFHLLIFAFIIHTSLLAVCVLQELTHKIGDCRRQSEEESEHENYEILLC